MSKSGLGRLACVVCILRERRQSRTIMIFWFALFDYVRAFDVVWLNILEQESTHTYTWESTFDNNFKLDMLMPYHAALSLALGDAVTPQVRHVNTRKNKSILSAYGNISLHFAKRPLTCNIDTYKCTVSILKMPATFSLSTFLIGWYPLKLANMIQWRRWRLSRTTTDSR